MNDRRRLLLCVRMTAILVLGGMVFSVVYAYCYPPMSARLFFSRDPDFQPTTELIIELGDGLQTIDWHNFSHAESLEQMEFIREELLDLAKHRKSIFAPASLYEKLTMTLTLAADAALLIFTGFWLWYISPIVWRQLRGPAGSVGRWRPRHAIVGALRWWGGIQDEAKKDL